MQTKLDVDSRNAPAVVLNQGSAEKTRDKGRNANQVVLKQHANKGRNANQVVLKQHTNKRA